MSNISTTHRVVFQNSKNASVIDDNSIDLVLTSPPYPMIEMWDHIMSEQNREIKSALSSNQGMKAFELMHQELDKVWKDVKRILKPGGIACVNIGDATRTIDGNFALYPNHSRIISSFLQLGFNNLPNIIWRKQTNAPNKYMGSGMLPAGAYVTLEHEWILVFRKGGKREFKSNVEKSLRRSSSFFWEERNNWFSDLWQIKGVRQAIENSESRQRSAAYPFELAYRIVNMYSVKGDIVYDPFLGTGTSLIASMASQRNSIGLEIDNTLAKTIYERLDGLDLQSINLYIKERIKQHASFVDNYNKEIKHYNHHLKIPVVTSQETDIQFAYINSVVKNECSEYKVSYVPVKNIEEIPPTQSKKRQPTLGF